MADQPALPWLLRIAKEGLTVLREIAVCLFFLLLFACPTRIRTILNSTGITSLGGVAFAPLQDANKNAENAGTSLAPVEPKLQWASDVLVRLIAQTTDLTVKRDLQSVLSVVKSSQGDASAANQSLKRSLAAQQDALQQLAPQTTVKRGWIYLGQMDESKSHWLEGSPVTVQRPPSLSPASTLYVKDDVYLHADAHCGSRTEAPVLGVIREGRTAEVLQVDYCFAAPGSQSVWAKVRPSP
ncbi:MAG: hypothetical protein M0000_10035 [Actinomycetota bacterium]|nr:hypothetical protein [Actinomycetota bacterium]